jgi:hypothetical protein
MIVRIRTKVIRLKEPGGGIGPSLPGIAIDLIADGLVVGDAMTKLPSGRMVRLVASPLHSDALWEAPGE